MGKNAKISLAVACFSLLLFLISSLVFKTVKVSDWILLCLSVIEFGMFFYYLKKKK